MNERVIEIGEGLYLIVAGFWFRYGIHARVCLVVCLDSRYVEYKILKESI